MKINREKLRNSILSNEDRFVRDLDTKNFCAEVDDIHIQVSSSGNVTLTYDGVNSYVTGFKNVYDLLHGKKMSYIEEFVSFDD